MLSYHNKYPQQLETITSVCQSFALDNGAFCVGGAETLEKIGQSFTSLRRLLGKKKKKKKKKKTSFVRIL